MRVPTWSIFARDAETLGRGQRWEGQTVNYRKDGSQFVMEWSITPLRDRAGEITHFVGVQRDVTARIEAERRVAQAQQAARESDRKRANLARYFSPAMVEILAQRDHPLGSVRRQAIAVLFVDIVGFVAISESLAPERVVDCFGILPSDIKGDLCASGFHREVLGRWANGAVRSAQIPRIEATDALHAAVNIWTRWTFRMLSGLKPAAAPDVGVSAISAWLYLAIGTAEVHELHSYRDYSEHREQNAGTVPSAEITPRCK